MWSMGSFSPIVGERQNKTKSAIQQGRLFSCSKSKKSGGEVWNSF